MTRWSYDLDGNLVHPDWHFTLDGDYEPKGTRYTVDGERILPNISLDGLTPQQAIDLLQKLR